MDAITRRRALVGTIAGAVAATPMHHAGHAQGTSAAWPTRPVRIIVPFPAGGTTDLLARILAQPLGEKLGQPVVVDNRPGAGGNIGADVVAKATDGHTLLMATIGTAAINYGLYRNSMPYKPACTAPGSLDNGLAYAARLKVSSCQAVRMSAGLRWPFFSISHSAL
jgi:tripartite-type tricarboxylate transporter receptor subunit TctC